MAPMEDGRKIEKLNNMIGPLLKKATSVGTPLLSLSTPTDISHNPGQTVITLLAPTSFCFGAKNLQARLWMESARLAILDSSCPRRITLRPEPNYTDPVQKISPKMLPSTKTKAGDESRTKNRSFPFLKSPFIQII